MLSKTTIGPSPYHALVRRLLDSPSLVTELQALPAPRFAALVREIGLEDAGELVAMATTEQLVTAFDEDLFVSQRPGERETFDPDRFITWLEVLLEAGDRAAADRVAELSPDFVVRALSSLLLVLDHDALAVRMSEAGRQGARAEKAIESSLSEEIDGYLLIARRPDGWDAVLALILALDERHRGLLERLLDRCAYLCRGYVDDLAALHEVLSAEESLAEDVEAEREERRTILGYVEPRAARSFLALCRQPLAGSLLTTPRDPVTAAYFRARQGSTTTATTATTVTTTMDTAASHRAASPLAELLAASEPGAERGESAQRQLAAGAAGPSPSPSPSIASLLAALHELHALAPSTAASRMDELGYLANVLVAGAGSGARGREPLRPLAAAEAALATVALGAELAAQAARDRKTEHPATTDELLAILKRCPADILFRGAASALASQASLGGRIFVASPAELAEVLPSLTQRPARAGARSR